MNESNIEEFTGLEQNKSKSSRDKNICDLDYEMGSNHTIPDKEDRDEVSEKKLEVEGFAPMKDWIMRRESGIEVTSERKNLYTNKSVALFQERNYQTVKDICIDSEVPYRDKFMGESCELGCDFTNASWNSELKEVKVIDDDHSVDEDVTKKFASEEYDKEDDIYYDAREGIGTDVSLKLLSVRESAANYSHSQLSDSIGRRGEEWLSQESQVPNKETAIANSVVSLEFDSSRTTWNKREEDMPNLDSELTLKIKNTNKLAGEFEENAKISSQNSEVGSHSGPLQYSGSVSMRSNSSTASAHSFAFPILHSEWNSSPVRMVKAEPRRRRKYHCWVKRSLLCCKF